MQFEESKAVRSFIGRVEPGDDVLEALTLLCTENDVRAADVRIAGTVRDVELVRLDAESREYETFVEHRGLADVVQFSGNLAMLGDQPVFRAEAMLAIDGPVGQQFVFGQLRRAQAVDCEFVIYVFADLDVRRKLDPATGRIPITGIERVAGGRAPSAEPTPPAGPEPAPRRAPPETISEPALSRVARPETPPQQAPAPAVAEATPREKAAEERSEKPSMSWDDAVAAAEDLKPASKRQARPIPRRNAAAPDAADVYGEYDYEEPLPGPGDILDHPKLGECRVIKVEDDEYAHIRLSRGQIRKLALQFVELIHEGERDGKNVFKVRVNK